MVTERKAKRSLKRAEDRLRDETRRAAEFRAEGNIARAEIIEARLPGFTETAGAKTEVLKTADPNRPTARPADEMDRTKPTAQEVLDNPLLRQQPVIQTLDPIRAERPEEKKTLGQKALGVLTSPKTTLVLAGVLATLLSAGTITAAGVSRAGTAVITRTTYKKAGTLAITRSVRGKIVERSVVGKKATALLEKVPYTTRAVASRYASNTKSKSLTKSILSKAGLSVGVLGITGTVVGTYPFAEFELAEATDKIGIAMFRASQEGDHKRVVELAAYLEDMLDESVWEQVVNKIPFANVFQSVTKNILAARKSAETLRELALDSSEKLTSGEESEFEKSRRESDEAAFERKRAFAEEETERFEGIEKERTERETAEREEETQKFADIEEERKARAIEEQEIDIMKSRVFALRRDGKFAEADEVEQEILRRLEGGG